MTNDKIQLEIDALTRKLEQLKQDTLITSGALQAFQYMQKQLENDTAAQAEGQEVPHGD